VPYSSRVLPLSQILDLAGKACKAVDKNLAYWKHLLITAVKCFVPLMPWGQSYKTILA
jgi:hypothetical protein